MLPALSRYVGRSVTPSLECKEQIHAPCRHVRGCPGRKSMRKKSCRYRTNHYLCKRILLKVKTNLSVYGKLRTGAIASGLARREICLKPGSCPCLRAGDRLGRKGNSPCKAPKADRWRLYLRSRFLEAWGDLRPFFSGCGDGEDRMPRPVGAAPAPLFSGARGRFSGRASEK